MYKQIMSEWINVWINNLLILLGISKYTEINIM